MDNGRLGKQFLDVEASGFFVLRTPLLPFDELAKWGQLNELWHSKLNANDYNPVLEEDWRSNVELLRERLRLLVKRPEVHKAISAASNSLEDSLRYWVGDPECKKGLRTEHALVRYFARMCGRSTPFGMFSGCSVGIISCSSEQTDPSSRLTLQSLEEYHLRTQLDYDFLVRICEELRTESPIKRELCYWPNPSIHVVGGELHYVERQGTGETRTSQIAKLTSDLYLDRVMQRAKAGATIGELIESLLDLQDPTSISAEAAIEYIEELIANDVIIPDLYPPLTGPSALRGLITQLESVPSARSSAHALKAAEEKLADLDKRGISAPLDEYRQVASDLQNSLGLTAEPFTIFHFELYKPLANGYLPAIVTSELVAAAEVLLSITQGKLSIQGELQEFRKAFVDRYERAYIPLLEVLDEDLGVGFGANRGQVPAPLLRKFPAEEQNQNRYQGSSQELHPLFIQRLIECARMGSRELILDRADHFSDPQGVLIYPDAFCLVATIAAHSTAALEDGHFKIHLQVGAGPSGAVPLGRFCNGNPELENYVRAHLCEEEAHDHEAIYAEVVYAPNGRAANLSCRPTFRSYEIVCSSRSGMPRDQQLPISDLFVSISESGKIILYSGRHRRRVIPRLSSAHNFAKPGLPSVYRFLCALQYETSAGIAPFMWGMLSQLEFLPRVTVGRTTITCAQWLLSREEIGLIGRGSRYDSFTGVQYVRQKRGLPRWVTLGGGEDNLPIDLDNPLSVDAFVHLLRRGGDAILREMYPQPDELCCTGPEGRFYSELIVPFVRRVHSFSDRQCAERQKPNPDITSNNGLLRMLPPGSSWSYWKLYGGPVALDELLRNEVRVLVESAFQQGFLIRWFFVRYSDPDTHLRLRFELCSSELSPEFYRFVTASLGPLLNARRLRSFGLDTYQREIERYGGAEGLLASECLFCADSDAVLKMLAAIDGKSDALRWKIALLGVDHLFRDCLLTLTDRLSLATRMRDGFQKELGSGIHAKKYIAETFRSNRENLVAMMSGGLNNIAPFASVQGILESRSARIACVMQSLHYLSRSGRLQTTIPDLVSSYAHMHINRIMSSQHRRHEAVMYELLFRLYNEAAIRSQ